MADLEALARLCLWLNINPATLRPSRTVYSIGQALALRSRTDQEKAG